MVEHSPYQILSDIPQNVLQFQSRTHCETCSYNGNTVQPHQIT